MSATNEDGGPSAASQEDFSSFLGAAIQHPGEELAIEPTTTAPGDEDIENQQSQQAVTNPTIGILASRKGKSTNEESKDDANDNDNSSDTDSVFSFDSIERGQRIPTLPGQSTSSVPFPSVNAASLYAQDALTNVMSGGENVCPCRCLFFTVKESICLVLSALGCGVFLAGLIVLCLYLEGSLFGA